MCQLNMTTAIQASAEIAADRPTRHVPTIEYILPDLEEGLPDEETPTPELEPATGSSGGGDRIHHCHPSKLGGSDTADNKVTMSEVRHKLLNNLMRKYMQQIFSVYSRPSMDMVKGRNGLAVREDFGMDAIRQAVQQFYEDNKDKFPECL